MSTFTCRRGKNKTRSVKAAWVFLWSSWVTLSNTCLTSLDFLILVLHVKSVDPSMNKKQEEGRIVVRTSQQFVYDTFASFLSKTLRPNIFSEKGNGTLLDSSNYWFTQIGPLPCLMHNLVSFKTKLMVDVFPTCRHRLQQSWEITRCIARLKEKNQTKSICHRSVSSKDTL